MVGVDRIQEILGDKPGRDYLDRQPLSKAMREEVDWIHQGLVSWAEEGESEQSTRIHLSLPPDCRHHGSTHLKLL